MSDPLDGPWPVAVPADARCGPARRHTGEKDSWSVVIAAYQARATLAEAIDSALGQTFPISEVVVCDDGSTDGTAEVVDEADPRVRLFRQSNAGESAAKNAAVRAADSDWIVVLDADDVFLPQRVEAMAWLAEQCPDLDVITTDAYLEVDGDTVRQAYHQQWRFEVADQRAGILERNFVFGLAAVRRMRWLEVGGFDESLQYTADWDFWIRLILSGSRVGLVETPLARYRLQPGSLSSDRARMAAARIRTLSKAADIHLSSRERAVVEQSLAAQRVELAVQTARAALDLGATATRRAAVDLVRTPGVSPTTKAKAIATAVLPRTAAKIRSLIAGGTVETTGGVRVRRPGDRRTAAGTTRSSPPE